MHLICLKPRLKETWYGQFTDLPLLVGVKSFFFFFFWWRGWWGADSCFYYYIYIYLFIYFLFIFFQGNFGRPLIIRFFFFLFSSTGKCTFLYFTTIYHYITLKVLAHEV